MIQYAYLALRQFPKSEKFTLAADIKRSMFRVLELIVRANRARHKLPLLQEIDVELDVLRSLVRLSRDLTFLSFKKYEVWSRYLEELGKMLGGWIRSAQRGRAVSPSGAATGTTAPTPGCSR